jgi:hypothetical protein
VRTAPLRRRTPRSSTPSTRAGHHDARQRNTQPLKRTPGFRATRMRVRGMK